LKVFSKFLMIPRADRWWLASSLIPRFVCHIPFRLEKGAKRIIVLNFLLKLAKKPS
jgi:hypothetical protein